MTRLPVTHLILVLYILVRPSLVPLEADNDMAPTIILIRHAEGVHNVLRDFGLHDPQLTELGAGLQCKTLGEALQQFSVAQDIELIVSSPMRRTLQTASRALGWLMDRGVPALVMAEFQENTLNMIDVGRPVEDLETEFPGFDFSKVDPIFPSKTGLYKFSKAALTERGEVARKWLKERKEKVIAVVSHDGFMRVGLCHRKFGNADFRVFEFSTEGFDLVEWEVTEERGGGLGTSPKGHFGWLPNDFKYMPDKGEK